MESASETDLHWMRQAHACAEQSLWLSNPNPRVGCVIVSAQGQKLAEGHTQAAGSAHAEVMALNQARALGHDVKGATVYVTLEPCSHHGRTPPCCDALVSAGVARVVAACIDPNPKVRGQGLERLRANGIQVLSGVLAEQTRTLNPGFFQRIEQGRPWVRMKVAASLDGQTALQNRISQWITSPQARADGHAFRARACVVMSGIGTLLADNPRLDVREVNTPRQPQLVVVDSQLRCPTPMNWQQVHGRTHHVFHARPSLENSPNALALKALGVHLHCAAQSNGKVDLNAMMQRLSELEVNEIHLETGQQLNGAMLEAGLVDEVLLYVAPKWIGTGMGMSLTQPLQRLQDAWALQWIDITPVGPDLRIRAQVLRSAST